MGRSKGNLGRRVPPIIQHPPNKSMDSEWWEDGKNLMRLHPSYPQRSKYVEKRQKQKD